VWFGAATSDWEFDTLRGTCSDLRERATGHISQIRNKIPAESLELEREIRDLKKQAEQRHCSLHVGVDPAQIK
jgi:hypothetical protein